MWIERGELRLTRDAEVKTSRAGTEYVVLGGGFPAPKDSPQGTPRVWFSARAFDNLDLLRTAAKGSTVIFKGKFESNTWTNRDGETKTEPQLVIREVFEVREAQPWPDKGTMAAVGQRHAQPLPTDGDDTEELPF